MKTIVNDTKAGNLDAREYHNYIQHINVRFGHIDGPLFQTDATGLYEAYLASFGAGSERQYHTCHCCRQFIERFGGVAFVTDGGLLMPAFWIAGDAPPQYLAGVDAMARIVRSSHITMPFLSSDRVYGTPATGQWRHFAVTPPASRVFKATPLKTAFQAASEKREELASVMQALIEYNPATVTTALALLKSDSLANSQAVLGKAQFLADLHTERERIPKGHSERRLNLTWRAVATAPAGFCHPRSSMVATLLDDIAAGKSFDEAKAAWTKKMHPLQYMRPQAAPTAGAIAAAERDFEKLGAASALLRRHATMDDILEFVWRPKGAAKATPAGIFSGILAKAPAPASAMRAPPTTVTWDKFQRTVLPTVDSMEIYCPQHPQNFATMTTAVNPDSLPILQWDSAERRNPVAMYLWHGGSMPSSFGLQGNQYSKVTGVTLRPHMWFGGTFEHQSVGAIFIIDGAHESRKDAGNALFPVTLKSEFHGMRSVIEAHSRTAVMTGREQGVCGLHIGENQCGARLRVTIAGQIAEYLIDRWD
jgi:hypothetical protein